MIHAVQDEADIIVPNFKMYNPSTFTDKLRIKSRYLILFYLKYLRGKWNTRRKADTD